MKFSFLFLWSIYLVFDWVCSSHTLSDACLESIEQLNVSFTAAQDTITCYYLASSESVSTACSNEAFLLSMKILDSYFLQSWLLSYICGKLISRLSSCCEVYLDAEGFSGCCIYTHGNLVPVSQPLVFLWNYMAEIVITFFYLIFPIMWKTASMFF